MTAKPAGNPLRAALFHAGMYLSIVVWGILSLFTVVLPYRWRFWFVSRWCLWMGTWLRLTCGIDHEVEGLDNIRGLDHGVVMSKHQSAWETFTLVNWFYPQTWVLKRELMYLPVFGWALALLDPIAIDRAAGRDAVRQVTEKGRARLTLGRWVVVFPEGTRVPAGRKARYRLGGAVLACATETPVVPVAHNAGEHWPRSGFRLRPGTIQVRIGPAIDTRGKTPDTVISEVEAWIEARMPAISSDGYSGKPFERATQKRRRKRR